MIPPTGPVLALDWGTRRIGIAISDETQVVATPLAVLTRRTGRRVPLGRILEIVEARGPAGILVGLPLTDDGAEGESASAARGMGSNVARLSGLPVEFADEAFTTRDAHHAARAAGQRLTPHDIDAHAAATLLQQWLDRRARNGARQMVSPIGLLAAFAITATMLAGCGGTGAIERVPIPPGSTVHAAADSLAAHHVIRSTAWFTLRARWSHVDRSLHAGIYRFTRGAGTATALRALSRGEAVRFRVTLPIGGTVFDLAHHVEQQLAIPHDSFLQATRDSATLRRFDIDGPSVEGFLLPESFDFGGFDSARAVLTRFLTARRLSWDSTWDRRASAIGMSRAELLTLASIVEAEVKDPSERPLIAAVYRNRLRRSMPLQADPTIEYAYLLRDGERKGRLFNSDYLLDSPWNTYRHPGLPPGPIDNPSRESIEATLSPAPVAYLYFVAGPDGRSRFATTMTQHLRNINQVRP